MSIQIEKIIIDPCYTIFKRFLSERSLRQNKKISETLANKIIRLITSRRVTKTIVRKTIQALIGRKDVPIKINTANRTKAKVIRKTVLEGKKISRRPIIKQIIREKLVYLTFEKVEIKTELYQILSQSIQSALL